MSTHEPLERSILVTGGAGFVGSHLCERLIADGHRVVCLDNLQTGAMCNLSGLSSEPYFEFIEHDVINSTPAVLQFRKTPFTHVFHLACAASPPQYQADPEHTMLTNVVGTANILRLSEDHGARFILASTSEVYGDPEMHPQSEDYRGSVNCIGPRACYDEGKRSAEALAFDFLRTGRCDTRVARIFNTYGPRMQADDGRVVSNFITQGLQGKSLEIYGDGSQTRSFCYVSDLVNGLVKLANSEATRGMPVNLGNPEELSVGGLADLINELLHTDVGIALHPLPEDDPKRRKPDISRAKLLLDWEPEVDLRSGLVSTIEWFRRQRMSSNDHPFTPSLESPMAQESGRHSKRRNAPSVY